MKIENMTLQNNNQYSISGVLSLTQKLTQRITIAMLTTLFSISLSTNLVLAQQLGASTSKPRSFSTPHKSVFGKLAMRKTKTRNKFRTIYSDTKSKDQFTNSFFDSARRTKLLENVASRANLRLPRPVTFIMKDCGMENTAYDPKNNAITLCSEFVTYVNQIFIKKGHSEEKAAINTVNVILFTLYHEIGHLLIHELDLINMGKEEDSADQFAAITFLDSPNKNSTKVVESTSLFFLYDKDNLRDSRIFADSHSLNRQRAYYLLCELYVRDPDRYAKVVVGLKYSARELASCRQDSNNARRSWYRSLSPYIIR